MGFEAITVGNIANTPLSKTVPMSPTEIQALKQTIASEGPADSETDTKPMWEIISEESWSEPRLGETISNSFRRITRKATVEGGSLYAVATYGLTYVRGVADCSVSEAIQFVAGPSIATSKAARIK